MFVFDYIGYYIQQTWNQSMTEYAVFTIYFVFSYIIYRINIIRASRVLSASFFQYMISCDVYFNIIFCRHLSLQFQGGFVLFYIN